MSKSNTYCTIILSMQISLILSLRMRKQVIVIKVLVQYAHSELALTQFHPAGPQPYKL